VHLRLVSSALFVMSMTCSLTCLVKLLIHLHIIQRNLPLP